MGKGGLEEVGGFSPRGEKVGKEGLVEIGIVRLLLTELGRKIGAVTGPPSVANSVFANT